VAEARREQIVREARALLEREGPSGLSMRRLAERLDIRAPSLYKHLPGKADVEAAIIADGLRELGAQLAAAGPELGALAGAYRAFALAHPHLYTLMTDGPLRRDLLPEGIEQEIAAPLRAALPDEAAARAAWAAAHGLAALELAGRFPPGADLDAAWAAMSRAFAARDGER
jgi:AcrR family transcriptional regulator